MPPRNAFAARSLLSESDLELVTLGVCMIGTRMFSFQFHGTPSRSPRPSLLRADVERCTSRGTYAHYSPNVNFQLPSLYQRIRSHDRYYRDRLVIQLHIQVPFMFTKMN